MLQVNDLSYRYDNSQVLQRVTFSVEKGEFFGILGPNGSGKTTLLKLLSKELPLQEGTITLNGTPLASLSPKQLARFVAVLPQSAEAAFGYTVKETVELGRYAYQSGLLPEWTDADEQAVHAALAKTGLLTKQQQSIDRLSGGERQRVYLARALAQEPSLLLLDEPTNHMDIAQQVHLLDQLKQWTNEKRLTVVAIFHDMNLASVYCDRLLLLHEGKLVGIGEPSKLIEETTIQRVFGAAVRRQAHPVLPAPLLTFLPRIERTDVGETLSALTVTTTDEQMVVTTPKPFKVLSSAVVGAGFQWANYFVNRHVPKQYTSSDPEAEMKQYLRERSFDVQQTIGMMTAVYVEDAAFVYEKDSGVSLCVMVTAGVGNAVDVTKAWQQNASSSVGTINTMIFIDGSLTDAAFVQAVMTATEAKTKALSDEGVVDPATNTTATGTSTDCIAIAASQSGTEYAYAGSATPLGKAIGRAVYEATIQALRNYEKRKGERR
ncbi:adenosylcobinamide amidohydrolase [Anoxybacillus sp. J5B_2022]|uniref:adenosylcobinamide amidohydrolase n=1 Tax=Anoxybacillus sp. J5B_2022 TaxID=3003246 RepID=UPI002286A63E|nr:adenosylcobinamide amidohydrolase [Anoxybacillus sp. J5B_2022]MCZ0754550.1 adenosylcobinamide amidohydrolase [Anoxybacillus sp. J5B_2022]